MIAPSCTSTILDDAHAPGLVPEPDVVASGSDVGDAQPLVVIDLVIAIVLALVATPGLLSGRRQLQRHDRVEREIPEPHALAVGGERPRTATKHKPEKPGRQERRDDALPFDPPGGTRKARIHIFAASRRTTAGSSRIEPMMTSAPASLKSGLGKLARRMGRAGKSDHARPGRAPRRDAARCVLDHDAAVGRLAERLGGEQVEIGRRLAVGDLDGAEHVVAEQRGEPGHLERQPQPFGRVTTTPRIADRARSIASRDAFDRLELAPEAARDRRDRTARNAGRSSAGSGPPSSRLGGQRRCVGEESWRIPAEGECDEDRLVHRHRCGPSAAITSRTASRGRAPRNRPTRRRNRR